MEPTTVTESTAGPLRNELAIVRGGSNTRWSAAFAGAVVTASLWIVLHLFGMGVGMIAVDPDDPGSLGGLGVGAGIWSVLAPILALFVGGMVVSRLAPTPNRANRMIQAGLMWGVTTLFAITTLAMAVSTVVAGAASAGGRVASAMGDMAAKAASAADSDTLEGMGLDGDALLAQINQRLRAEGKPQVTGDELQAAVQDALGTAIQTGRLDRAMVVTALARDTALTPADANDLANRIDARWRAVQARAHAMMDRARHAALQTIETTGKALLALAGALLLGLAAALGGSLLTGDRDRRAERMVVMGRTGI